MQTGTTPTSPSAPEPSPSARVRRATPADVAAIDAMIHELAEYEREPDAVEATPEDLRAALFSEGARAHAHVAEVRSGGQAGEQDDGQDGGGWTVVGTAVWYVTYSTWTGRSGIWLEDLYVRPTARGAGLGRALLAALAAECVERGYRRLEWWVLDWNTSAQGVYRAVGARPEDDWTVWRLDGDGLTALAAGAPVTPGGR